MNPKTGRPVYKNPRQMRVETKMTIEELEKLDYCCVFLELNRSEIIRKGIDKIYTELNNLK